MGVTTYKRTFGPLALTNVLTTNVYNQGSALIYDIIRQLHIANKTSGPVTFSLWLGGTGANAAGTELFVAKSIPANDVYDWNCNMKMLSTDFLVGGASAVTSLSITAFGEQYVA